MLFENFDAFVKENNIKLDEQGAAFAAYLNQTTGWDGKVEKVD